MPDSAPNPGVTSRTALYVVGAVLVLAVGYALLSRAPAPSGSGPEGSSQAAAPSQLEAPSASRPGGAPPDPIPIEPVPVADLAIESSGRLEVSLDELPEGEPVLLSLLLGEPSATPEARGVRLVSRMAGRKLDLAGRLNAERTAATIEIDRDFLEPGSYLVEVDTTERTHFPIRRYVLVVR